MRRSVFALALVGLVATLVQAQSESYTIKLKEYAAKGQVVKMTEKETYFEKIKVTDEAGKVLRNDEPVRLKEQVCTEKITVIGDKGPDTVVRKYEKATLTNDRRTITAPLQGRTITFQFRDGKARVITSGEPALPKELIDFLAREASQAYSRKKQAMVPKTTVKVGESWTLTAKDLAAGLGMAPAFAAKVKGTGKLAKVYEKNGKQWGTLNFTIKIPLPAKGKEKAVVSTMEVVVDTPIDGSSSDDRVKSTVKTPPTKTVIEQAGKKITINSSYTVTINSERTEVK